MDQEISNLKHILKIQRKLIHYILQNKKISAAVRSANPKGRERFMKEVTVMIPEILMSNFTDGSELFVHVSNMDMFAESIATKYKRFIAYDATDDIRDYMMNFPLNKYISASIEQVRSSDYKVLFTKDGHLCISIPPFSPMKFDISLIQKKYSMLTHAQKKIVPQLIVRYLATYRTELHQLAVPNRDRAPQMDIEIELYASAFNKHAPYFCSAFPDLERPFGSIGRFDEATSRIIDADGDPADVISEVQNILSRDANTQHNNVVHYWCNPPYENNIMTKTFKTLARILGCSQKCSVYVVIPVWDGQGYVEMLKSSHMAQLVDWQRKFLENKAKAIRKQYGDVWDVRDIIDSTNSVQFHDILPRWHHPFIDYRNGAMIPAAEVHVYLLANYEMSREVIEQYKNINIYRNGKNS